MLSVRVHPGDATEARQERVAALARQLGVIASKRVGLSLGLWGAPGVGKTHTIRAVLERLPCQHFSLPAISHGAQIAQALGQAAPLPAWAHTQLERLERGERLDKTSFAVTLSAALGALAPCVLHFEDIHELNAERLEALETLARAVPRLRGVALLVTSRAEPPSSFRSQRLEPLSLRETDELLSQELQATPPREALGWMYQRTQGNALFVLEFTRYLRRQGWLWSDGQRWHWRAPTEGFVPTTIEAMISQLVDAATTTPQAKAVLETRALLFEESDTARLERTWGHMAQVNPDELLAYKREFERLGLFHGHHFAHPLQREQVNKGIHPERRSQYARRGLEHLGITDVVALTALIAEAQLPPAAASAHLERVIAAARLSGDEATINAGLAALSRYQSGTEQVQTTLEAVRGLRSQRTKDALDLLEQTLNAQPDNLELNAEYALMLLSQMRLEEARALLERLPLPEDAMLAWEWQIFQRQANKDRLGLLEIWNAHPEFWEAASDDVHKFVMNAMLVPGQQERALEFVSHMLNQPNLKPRSRLNMLALQAMTLSKLGRNPQAETVQTQALELAQRSFPNQMAGLLHNRAIIRNHLYRFHEAITDAREALRLNVQKGGVVKTANNSSFLGNLLYEIAEFEASEQLLLESLSVLERVENGFYTAACCDYLSRLYLNWNPAHGPVLARHYAQRSLELLRHLKLPMEESSSLEHSIEAQLALGAIDSARQLTEDFAALAEHIDRYSLHARCERLRGQVCQASGETLQAEAHLERSLEILRAREDTEAMRRVQIELNHVRGDLGAARAQLEWFQTHQRLAEAHRLKRYFPELDQLKAPDSASAAPTAKLRVLGAISLERDGQVIPTRARKRLEFLTYLLEARISGRAEVRSLDLIDALYSEMPEPEARKALKQLVYLNRSALGADSIVSTATGYALGAVLSDAEAFLQTGDPALWRGSYLGDLSEGWLPGVRDALTLALRDQIEALLGPNPSEAARLGLILLEMEPFDRPTLHLAVRALQGAGKLKAAQVTYREGRARLLELAEALPEDLNEFLSAVKMLT